MITKASEALREARKLIESRDCMFVTSALHRISLVRDNGADSLNAQHRVIVQIRKLLDGRTCLEDWLADYYPELRGPNGNRVTSHPDYPVKIRLTRLAWIDDMIAYFEAKGD